MSFSLCKDGLREWIFLEKDWRRIAESLINKGFQCVQIGFKSRTGRTNLLIYYAKNMTFK